MRSVEQGSAPSASRRAFNVSSIRESIPVDLPKQARSHSLHLYSRSRTPSLLYLFIAVGVSLFLFTLFSFPSPHCDQHSFRLIPDLERWADPTYAASRLRIYVYDLPKRFNQDLVDYSIRNRGHIRDPRCDTNFYSSEVHVHRFLQSSSVRTDDPEEADFFYVPIYTTCDLITHQPNNVQTVGENFRQAMDLIITQYPYWNRTSGRNHVYLFSQGFSARLAGDWTRYKNGIFMVHNGEYTAPEYTPHKDITIPPELRAYLEPYWVEQERTGSTYEKKYLGQFGGQVVSASVSDHRGSNYSGGVRQYMQAHLTTHADYRITGVRSNTYLADMKTSKFCLAPEGWHPWSPRPYYGVLMGCIPVIISEVQELAFEEFVDWDSFAVWVRPSDISNLDAILRSFSEAELERRREAMKAIWRVFWYAGDGLANQAILRSLYLRKYDSSPRRQFSTISGESKR